MAINTTLFEKSRGNGQQTINGVYAMLHASDSTVETTAALRLAAAIATANSVMGVTLPSNYFDVAETALGTVPSYLDADDDSVIFAGTQVIRTIA